MKLFTTSIAILGLTNLFAQGITVTYNKDGSFQIADKERNSSSVEKIDAEGKTTAMTFYFSGGQRAKMSDEYTYKDDMLVERLGYLYTSGYNKSVYQYDERGNELDWKEFASKDKKTWKMETSFQREFDHRNNLTYVKCWKTRGSFYSSMSRFDYNYSAGTYSEYEEDYDENGRITSSNTRKRKIGKRALNNAPYVFDIDKHGENLRHNRVVKWSGIDKNGYSVDKLFMNGMVSSRAYDAEGRMVQLILSTAHAYDDDGKPKYSDDQIIDYAYSDGKLVEIIGKNYNSPLEKRVFDHLSSGQVRMTLYRKPPSGAWSKYSTKTLANIDKYTPPKRSGVTAPVSATVSESSASTNPTGSATNSGSNGGNSSLANGTLVHELNKIEETNDLSELKVSSDDAEKLKHIAKILEHSTGQKVSEQQLINLALELLIKKYNADLKESNNEYLEDKVAMFDE